MLESLVSAGKPADAVVGSPSSGVSLGQASVAQMLSMFVLVEPRPIDEPDEHFVGVRCPGTLKQQLPTEPFADCHLEPTTSPTPLSESSLPCTCKRGFSTVLEGVCFL